MALPRASQALQRIEEENRSSYDKQKREYYQKTFGFNIKEKKTEKDISVILVNPEPVPQIRSEIYELFQRKDFCVPTLIQCYYERLKDPGPHQYLTNKLYQASEVEIEFYTAQLCYILIQNEAPHLEKFISFLCAKSIAMYHLVSWCWISYSDKERKDPKKLPRLQQIDNNLKQSMVNIGQTTQIRNNREGYQEAVALFLKNVIEMSMYLKSQYKPEERKPTLKNFIIKVNKALEKYREANQEYQFCHGIMIPFSCKEEEGSIVRSTMVVRLIEGECTCFNTKKRVPYRIVVETIDPNELEQNQPKFGNHKHTRSSSNLSQVNDGNQDCKMDDFISTFADPSKKDEIEKKLAEIAKNRNGRDFTNLKNYQQQMEEEQKQHSILNDLKAAIQKARQGGAKEAVALEKQYQDQLNEFEKGAASKGKSFKNAIERENYYKNLKRFEILFHQRTVERTSSCISKLLHPYQQQKQRRDPKYWLSQFKKNPMNAYRFCHRTIRDITIVSRIKFFRKLFQETTDKKLLKLQRIYLNLQYDLYEKEIEKQKKLLSNTHDDMDIDVSFARKFGPWDELWEDKAEVIKRNSPYAHFNSYRLRPIIVKGGDDLRQELMTMQIIKCMKEAFQANGLNLYVKAYEIIVVSANSGLLEFCTDTLSIDGLKKKFPGSKSLVHIYKEIFGYTYEEAQLQFVQSLAAYSIIAYLLQIKDRHNGNILIDSSGRIIHIDFGFILSSSPGRMNFESAPFKLTMEYVDLMNGQGSDLFRYFENLIFRGFKALKSVVGEICLLIEIMMVQSDLPCFEKFDLQLFRDRFQENATDEQLQEYVQTLIYYSFDNWKTTQYDNFQRYQNGIMP